MAAECTALLVRAFLTMDDAQLFGRCRLNASQRVGSDSVSSKGRGSHNGYECCATRLNITTPAIDAGGVVNSRDSTFTGPLLAGVVPARLKHISRRGPAKP